MPRATTASCGPTSNTDPFRHLPGLRDRIKPAQLSELRVTREVLAQWDRRAQAQGRAADWRLSDEQIDASQRTVLAGMPPAQDLWIFGYGSLMWDPGFHFAEVRRADLRGYQRRFSYRTTLGRGSPELPGMMLTLDRAEGVCSGLAFRVDCDMAHGECALLWRREMIRGGYCPMLLPVTTPQGDITALAFAANREHADYVGELPIEQTGAIIARAAGVLGSNREYLEQLAAQLQRLGIDDAYVTQLHACVCR